MILFPFSPFRHQGYVSAYLIVGGYDQEGPHLWGVTAEGYTLQVPFMTLGSGSLAAMSVFENRWKENMEVGTCIAVILI